MFTHAHFLIFGLGAEPSRVTVNGNFYNCAEGRGVVDVVEVVEVEVDAAASAIAQTASRIAGARRDQSTSSALSWGQFGGEFTTGDTTATDKTSILSGIRSVVRVQYGPLRETPACRHVGVFRWCVACVRLGCNGAR